MYQSILSKVALPIYDVLDVPYRSTVSGVKHACGHDAEAAILLGVAEVLSSLRELLAGTHRSHGTYS